MNKLTIAISSLLIGCTSGYFGQQLVMGNTSHQESTATSKAPLYWVAPMDPNYKRDKPGKSPMGMDLIPVYEEESGSSAKDIPGTVKIDPSVVHNLGVRVGSVTEGHLTPLIESVGYIEFDESKLWQLNLRVSGWVKTTNIHSVGEKVKKGQVLFTLYSPELVNAQDELLNAYKTGRKVMIEAAKDRLLSLGLEKQQITKILKSQRVSETIEIKAAESGVVKTLNIREGNYLTPNVTALSAGILDTVWVNTEIFERQAIWVTEGTHAEMALSSQPSIKLEGKVDYIYPVIDSKTRTLRVRLVFNNADGNLKPNMFANITLKPSSPDTGLLIPKEAVIRADGMSRVVLDEGNGKFRSARIETGLEANGKIQVLKGLNKGDQVVTSAQFLIDSESSLSAELDRINGVPKPSETVWAVGEVVKVNEAANKITINHKPVKEWNWPGMIMDFEAAPGQTFTNDSIGKQIDFELTKTPTGTYQIVDYKLGDAAKTADQWITAKVTMIMPDFGMLSVSHGAIESLGWDSGEINFTVNDTIDLTPYSENDEVRVKLHKQGTDYVVTELAMAGGK